MFCMFSLINGAPLISQVLDIIEQGGELAEMSDYAFLQNRNG